MASETRLSGYPLSAPMTLSREAAIALDVPLHRASERTAGRTDIGRQRDALPFERSEGGQRDDRRVDDGDALKVRQGASDGALPASACFQHYSKEANY